MQGEVGGCQVSVMPPSTTQETRGLEALEVILTPECSCPPPDTATPWSCYCFLSLSLYDLPTTRLDPV